MDVEQYYFTEKKDQPPNTFPKYCAVTGSAFNQNQQQTTVLFSLFTSLLSQ